MENIIEGDEDAEEEEEGITPALEDVGYDEGDDRNHPEPEESRDEIIYARIVRTF